MSEEEEWGEETDTAWGDEDLEDVESALSSAPMEDVTEEETSEHDPGDVKEPVTKKRRVEGGTVLHAVATETLSSLHPTEAKKFNFLNLSAQVLAQIASHLSFGAASWTQRQLKIRRGGEVVRVYEPARAETVVHTTLDRATATTLGRTQATRDWFRSRMDVILRQGQCRSVSIQDWAYWHHSLGEIQRDELIVHERNASIRRDHLLQDQEREREVERERKSEPTEEEWQDILQASRNRQTEIKQLDKDLERVRASLELLWSIETVFFNWFPSLERVKLQGPVNESFRKLFGESTRLARLTSLRLHNGYGPESGRPEVWRKWLTTGALAETLLRRLELVHVVQWPGAHLRRLFEDMGPERTAVLQHLELDVAWDHRILAILGSNCRSLETLIVRGHLSKSAESKDTSDWPTQWPGVLSELKAVDKATQRGQTFAFARIRRFSLLLSAGIRVDSSALRQVLVDHLTNEQVDSITIRAGDQQRVQSPQDVFDVMLRHYKTLRRLVLPPSLVDSLALSKLIAQSNVTWPRLQVLLGKYEPAAVDDVSAPVLLQKLPRLRHLFCVPRAWDTRWLQRIPFEPAVVESKTGERLDYPSAAHLEAIHATAPISWQVPLDDWIRFFRNQSALVHIHLEQATSSAAAPWPMSWWTRPKRAPPRHVVLPRLAVQVKDVDELSDSRIQEFDMQLVSKIVWTSEEIMAQSGSVSTAFVAWLIRRGVWTEAILGHDSMFADPYRVTLALAKLAPRFDSLLRALEGPSLRIAINNAIPLDDDKTFAYAVQARSRGTSASSMLDTWITVLSRQRAWKCLRWLVTLPAAQDTWQEWFWNQATRTISYEACQNRIQDAVFATSQSPTFSQRLPVMTREAYYLAGNLLSEARKSVEACRRLLLQLHKPAVAESKDAALGHGELIQRVRKLLLHVLDVGVDAYVQECIEASRQVILTNVDEAKATTTTMAGTSIFEFHPSLVMPVEYKDHTSLFIASDLEQFVKNHAEHDPWVKKFERVHGEMVAIWAHPWGQDMWTRFSQFLRRLGLPDLWRYSTGIRDFLEERSTRFYQEPEQKGEAPRSIADKLNDALHVAHLPPHALSKQQALERIDAKTGESMSARQLAEEVALEELGLTEDDLLDHGARLELLYHRLYRFLSESNFDQGLAVAIYSAIDKWMRPPSARLALKLSTTLEAVEVKFAPDELEKWVRFEKPASHDGQTDWAGRLSHFLAERMPDDFSFENLLPYLTLESVFRRLLTFVEQQPAKLGPLVRVLSAFRREMVEEAMSDD